MDINMQKIEGGVCAAKGFFAAGIHCGVRKNKDKLDLAMIYSDKRCAAAAVYTTNKVKGAPIAVTKRNIADGYAQAVVCNSGNANTCTACGESKAETMCKSAGKALGIEAEDVIPASTGVIGLPLNIDAITEGMPALAKKLSNEGSAEANQAIMTTDTREKSIAYKFNIGGSECRIGAIAKGSGMIHPNMATMLCFITTDAAIAPAVLQAALSDVVKDTFNMVSVDGDTSTNDMTCVLANGEAGNKEISEIGSEGYEAFKKALFETSRYISREMARDGEGATKLIECKVNGAATKEDAKTAARAVVSSSLFKAAAFGADANWGRILCALGYSGAEFDPTKTDVTMSSAKGELLVCKGGSSVEFDEDFAKEMLSEDEIVVAVELNNGECYAEAWGCDLTYDYVKINGDYRT